MWSLDREREIGISLGGGSRFMRAATRDRRDRRARAALPDPGLDAAWRDDRGRRADDAQVLRHRAGWPYGDGRPGPAACGCWRRRSCALAAASTSILDTTRAPELLARPAACAGVPRLAVLPQGLRAAARGAPQGSGRSRRDAHRGRGRRPPRKRSPIRPEGRIATLPVDLLLLHQGVVPNVNLAMSAGVEAPLGRGAALLVAGSRRELAAARSRASRSRATVPASAARLRPWHRGRIAARAAVEALKPDAARKGAGADGACDAALARAERGRAFLDVLFQPPRQFRMPQGDTIVCRCEEVTARGNPRTRSRSAPPARTSSRPTTAPAWARARAASAASPSRS